MNKIINKLLGYTDLTMEQETAIRGRWKMWVTRFIESLKAVAFVMPLVFSLVLYSKDIDLATFWAILSIIGWCIYQK